MEKSLAAVAEKMAVNALAPSDTGSVILGMAGLQLAVRKELEGERWSFAVCEQGERQEFLYQVPNCQEISSIFMQHGNFHFQSGCREYGI